MAQILLVVLVSWRCGRVMRILGSLYAASMGFSLIYLAEHYLSDVLAGLLLATFSWAVAVRLTPSIRQAEEVQTFVSGSSIASEGARRAA